MRRTAFIFFLVLTTATACGQQRIIDSIKQKMPTSNDTLMLVWSSLLSTAYSQVNADSIPRYDQQYLDLCKKLDLSLQEVAALNQQSDYLTNNHPAAAIDLLYAAQKIIEKPANNKMLPAAYLSMLKIPATFFDATVYKKYLSAQTSENFAILYWLKGRNKKAEEYLQKALLICQSINAKDLIGNCYLALGVVTNSDDSGLLYQEKALQLYREIGDPNNVQGVENFMAQRYAQKKDFKSELFYRRSSLDISISEGLLVSTGWNYTGMADFYARSVIIPDSVLYYAHKAIEIADQTHTVAMQYWAASHLADTYDKKGEKDSAFKYLKICLAAKEEVSDENVTRDFEDLDYTVQSKQTAIEDARRRWNNNIKIYAFGGGLAVLALLAFIFWRNNKRKQREFVILQKQKAKTDEALQSLKEAQAQLIQSEKMASLGELTAGIAHEIQNPLNFVNNFSELNGELISEMNEEIKKGNYEDAIAIGQNIKDNQEKINHHGKRADAIVKGMLLHSRTSAGQKEPTDINALADEYLRLAYHGLRAKDKSFNSKFETSFDPSVGKLNVVQQDIGRVILNLITNAFYSVSEKKKRLDDSYEPLVTVTTRKINNHIEIIVRDNGNGVPSKVMDKIFQPFFTTKPTGVGTGLGLSLSYDIITKGHGGELKVDTKEGEYAEFIIILSP